MLSIANRTMEQARCPDDLSPTARKNAGNDAGATCLAVAK
jgi:hypothetical protein